MKTQIPRIAFCSALLVATTSIAVWSPRSATAQGPDAEKMPVKGEPAKDFRLPAIAGELSGEVQLSKVNAEGPVVLVVLRGFPGSQCPACTAQVADLVKHADEFAKKNARVLLIYPGALSQLDQRADEFLHGTQINAPLTFLLDPGFKFTNAYGLRWDAPNETSYPSTIVVDKSGKISFVTISETHRGRVSAKDVLAAL